MDRWDGLKIGLSDEITGGLVDMLTDCWTNRTASTDELADGRLMGWTERRDGVMRQTDNRMLIDRHAVVQIDGVTNCTMITQC